MRRLRPVLEIMASAIAAIVAGAQTQRRAVLRHPLVVLVAVVLLALPTLVQVQSAAGAGSWSSTGSLGTARLQHTATLLPSGKVLIAGGDGGGVAIASAELYDPADGTWSPTDSLSTPRLVHTAILLPNGKVLAAGGWNNGVSIASAELYDPITHLWSDTNNMQEARQSPTLTLLPDGRVLATGGIGHFGALLASAELYDPGNESWVPAASMAEARFSQTATLLPNGKVLVAGGAYPALSSAELYNPADDTWSAAGNLLAARHFHTATLLPNGKVLVAGGTNDVNALASAELYNPADNTWSAAGGMADTRFWHTATLLADGTVLSAGGTAAGGPQRASAEIYDPGTNAWSATGSLAAVRDLHTATLLPNGNVLVAAGSGPGGNRVASAELYAGPVVAAPESFTLPPTCTDGIDNDLNGLIDGADPGCIVTVAPGTTVQAPNIPLAAQCTSSFGTSIAIVPGFLVGLNQYPTLVVTSCLDTQTSSLYFLYPGTNPATLVKIIDTTPTPSRGWGALALRGSRGDLIGCGNDNASAPVYAIDINPYNATADGAATFLFNGVAQLGICDGLAWDNADNSIFQSPDLSALVYKYSETGVPLGSAVAACANSGLAVGGVSLYEACDGVAVMYQTLKANGVPFRSFGTGGLAAEDLECDPLTFAGSYVDAIWSRDPAANQFFALAVPAGSCGLAGGAPRLPARCPGGTTPDADGDGLLDCWETSGIDWNGDGIVDLQLYDVNGDGTIQPSEHADPNHKDIYVEIDWMAEHKPDAGVLDPVIAAFAAAPVSNPDSTTGIRLHLQQNEQAISHNNEIAFTPCTAPATGGVPDFNTVKSAKFGTAAERAGVNAARVLNAKRLMTHYALFAHNLRGLGAASGCGELSGNDFVVTLGSWPRHGHVPDHQASTFMHEFGHNLGLRHGGSEDDNCKPNYLSIMSYSRTFDGVPVAGRALDYSRAALPTLDEADLSEPAGIGGPAGSKTAYGPPPGRVAPGDAPIDWNRDGDATDTGVAADVNHVSFCDGAGAILLGFDDWSNLVYNFRNGSDFADGVSLTAETHPHIDLVEAMAFPDSDNDSVAGIIDNCPGVANPGQENTDSGPAPPAGNSGSIDNGPGVAGTDTTIPNDDAQGDACEMDRDNDGLPDAQDTEPLTGAGLCGSLTTSDGHPNPAGGDITDGDGNGPSWDTDGDGVRDGVECVLGTDPRNGTPGNKPSVVQCANFPTGGVGPNTASTDADNDGLTAAAEYCKWGTSDAAGDTDGDGKNDCVEANDTDGNGNQNFTGDTINSAKAALGIIARTMDFDLDGNGNVSFTGDTILSARMVNHVGGICP